MQHGYRTAAFIAAAGLSLTLAAAQQQRGDSDILPQAQTSTATEGRLIARCEWLADTGPVVKALAAK